jgi:hypothetical protein
VLLSYIAAFVVCCAAMFALSYAQLCARDLYPKLRTLIPAILTFSLNMICVWQRH